MTLPATRCTVNDGVTETCLSIEHLAVRATIVDTGCEATVVQRFWNHVPRGAIRYVFSGPPGSTISRLQLCTEDGTILSTTPRKTADLRRDLTDGAGKGSIDHNGGELIFVFLEDISGPQNLIFEINYFLNLVLEDPSRLRFHAPKHTASPRTSTRTLDVAPAPAPAERVNIVIDIYTPLLVSVTSSTHKITDTSYKRTAPNQYHRRASFTSPKHLATDFMLFISSEGFDSPRCIAQRNAAGAVAMQLSLIPRFDNLKSSPPQEYLFLIDHSYSMASEDRMETAKRTLVMLLHMLPHGTIFNIFSFSDDCVQFCATSTIYDVSSQKEAIDFVEQINVGSGTSIRGALQAAFGSRNARRHTVCFLITDGEDNHYGPQEVAAVVTQEVARAHPDSPLRVFAVGMGNMSDVGRETCDAVAQAGHGLYRLAEHSEHIMAECTTLFEAGRTFVLKNVSVDWNVSPHPVLQTPTEIPALQADSHVRVHALIEEPTCPTPDQVVVHAQRDGVGEILNFIIPVEEIRLTRTSARGDRRQQLMHTLAARGIVADRQRNSSTTITRGDADTITRLGMQYQLQTPFTPFVAVNTTTGRTMAVSTIAHGVLPTIDGEQGPRELAILVDSSSSAYITCPDQLPRSVAHAPAGPSIQPRVISIVSALSENEDYEFPVGYGDPVDACDVHSIPSPRVAETKSNNVPGDEEVEEAVVPRTGHQASTTATPAVVEHTPAPPSDPMSAQPDEAHNTISDFWRPDSWMCFIVCGRQAHARGVRRNSANRRPSNDKASQGVQDMSSKSGTATTVTYAVARKASVPPSSDATSPTLKASPVSRVSADSPPAHPETMLLYLPSRPVAFFDASARCPSTRKITNWKLALFGTPKPRPFCKTRKEEIDRQVQEFVEKRRAAMKAAGEGPTTAAHDEGRDGPCAEDSDEEVETRNVVEAQPEEDYDGSLVCTDGSAAQMDSSAQELIRMQAPDGSFPPTLQLTEVIGVPKCLEQAAEAAVESSIWATALSVMFLRKYLRSQRALRNRIVAKARDFLEVSGLTKVEIEGLLHCARDVLGSNVAAPANDLTIDLESR